MKVNISRLHSMVDQVTSDISDSVAKSGQLLAGLLSRRDDVPFQIIEGTTDEDLQKFLDIVNKKRLEVKSDYSNIKQLLRYRKYLRETISTLNSSSGILDKLLQVSILQKELSVLHPMRENMRRSCISDLDEVKDVAYYKSSFTNDNKSFLLGVNVFRQSDVDELSQEIETIEKKIRNIKDQIAFLNQTTTVDILSAEEYIAK